LSDSTVVIGLGNVAQADDGLGVHAVRALSARYEISSRVELVEGGTAGLLLVPVLADAKRAVVIDALDLGAEPGTLHRIAAREWPSAFLQRMTPHDAGLTDLLGATLLTGSLPDDLLVLGLQPQRIGWGCEPTPPVVHAMPRLVDAIADQLRDWECAVNERESICA